MLKPRTTKLSNNQSMRYFLFFFCLLFTTQLFGQRKKRVKPKKFFHVQSAFLIDNSFELQYRGFNFLNLGFSKVKNNTQRSLSLELIAFEVIKSTTLVRRNITEPLSGSKGRRLSAELVYNYSFALNEKITDGFFAGPSASFGYNALKTTPITTAQFPTSNNCLCLGLGMNTGYNWSLNKKTMLTISTRITLIDIGYLRTRVQNPAWTVRQQRSSGLKTDFIRGQFPLMVGMNFKL